MPELTTDANILRYKFNYIIRTHPQDLELTTFIYTGLTNFINTYLGNHGY